MSEAGCDSKPDRCSSAASGSMSANGESIEVENPGRRTIIGRVPRGGAEDVDRAVAAAAAALAEWRRMAARERGRILLDIAGRNRGAGGRARPPHRDGDGQRAAHPGETRGGPRRRHIPLLRRPRERDQGRVPAARREPAQLFPARAARGGGRDHSLERAGGPRRDEDRTGALHRQHAGAQGGRGRAARGAHDRGDLPALSPAFGAQRAHRLRRGSRGPR